MLTLAAQGAPGAASGAPGGHPALLAGRWAFAGPEANCAAGCPIPLTDTTPAPVLASGFSTTDARPRDDPQPSSPHRRSDPWPRGRRAATGAGSSPVPALPPAPS